MDNVASNNKRILRNTVFMYVRMLMVMAISLFTVRIVLKALGVVDYGINNVVGGIVAMMGFLSSTMTGASMRFFSFHLGRNDYKQLSRYFTITFWCYVIIAVVILILAETIGLWFLYNKLVIPESRLSTALWVYQFSIASFLVSMLDIPYRSLIVAREKMDIYAYVGIIEVLLKLAVAYLVFYYGSDKLLLYGFWGFMASAVISSFYVSYNVIKYPESRIKLMWDNKIFKDVFSYSSWSLFSSVAQVCRSQGINILLNMFFGVTVNASRAIAYQVNTAVNSFVTSFSQAVKPQITKYYAADDCENMLTLSYRSTRMCFYLIYLLSLPVLMFTEKLLALWLGDVSTTTVIFTRLVICVSIIEAIASPLKAVIAATGKIKHTQVINGSLLLLNLPISYVFLKLGYPPESAMIVAFVISFICHMVRVFYSCKLTSMTLRGYMKEAIIPIFRVIVAGSTMVLVILCVFREYNHYSLIVISLSFVSALLSIWYLGLQSIERKRLLETIKSKILNH